VSAIPDSIPQREYNNRLDMRGMTVFTIDPEDAKDFDDAVSLEILPNGLYRLGVHIADVSYFVLENSTIDKEALSRGTSVYLTNGVIPMLPEKLSNELCSLKEGVDRLAYSVFMNITGSGVIREYECIKSIIHNKKRFTYEEAQKIIDKDAGPFAPTLRNMHKLSKILYAKRIKEGSIDFESTETIFRFDKEGKPSEIIKKIRLDSHRLVEEFMLAANKTVAKHIARLKNLNQVLPFIYRIHEPPPPTKLNDFVALVEHLGYSLNIRNGITPTAIQKLLEDVRDTEEENIINEVAIRSMSKALYSEKNSGHFGLGFKYYTHFTSPIRRYPDLVVHRLLNEYEKPITKSRRTQLAGILPGVCEKSSETERTAMEAERSSVKVMQVEYMKRHVGDEFNAIITGVTAFGLFVEITDYLVEGLIHVRDLEDDYYTFNEKQLSLLGKKSKKRYRLGDKVKVQVIRVNPERRQIDFILSK
jgi:ribonuclease R